MVGVGGTFQKKKMRHANSNTGGGVRREVVEGGEGRWHLLAVGGTDGIEVKSMGAPKKTQCKGQQET